jgi:hypothetical protein
MNGRGLPREFSGFLPFRENTRNPKKTGVGTGTPGKLPRESRSRRALVESTKWSKKSEIGAGLAEIWAVE